ncbi:flagellar motor stator protein MotA [Allohahella sp. A8]|uniref:flagellar motor stator protein MotA n=1 Tax=Allohahella sp. A8 TaxID=3141461 RepID=UPI000C09253D|nr:flagellar motor stator protein MotA [Hahellaceae bacterium]|tara:strand:- start:1910 stop:2761 length:852 start_codon:yes stop_codon:yes gene_type:complete
MLLLIGSIVVLASVLGGYVLSHGELAALWQPFELVIIFGAALGAFLIANSFKTIKTVGASIKTVIVGSRFTRQLYLDLLTLLYELFDKSRKAGIMSIEADVDEPNESDLFNKYPSIQSQPKLRDFVCDYFRIVASGNMAAHELEGLIDMEITARQHELEKPGDAVHAIADGLPGFGIVAAVLGIVITMKSLGGPPAELGLHVAAALVGTFIGILAAYGFVGPLSSAIHHLADAEIKAYECTKMSILAFLGGQAPQIAIEFGRKTLDSSVRPSFQELNDHVKAR